MEYKEILSLLIAIVLVAIMAIGFYIAIRRSKGGKEEATKFLQGLAEHISASILEVINEFTPGKYSDLSEFEKDVLNRIYSDAWDYVEKEAATAFCDNTLMKTAFKFITKERVMEFVDGIMNEHSIFTIIDGTYAQAKMIENKDEENDSKLAKEYADQSKYVENSESIKLDPSSIDEPTADQKAALNPQRENDEDYDVEDESMEIITEEPVYISKPDKNGNTLYYKVDPDGRKTRISKAIALATGKFTE